MKWISGLLLIFLAGCVLLLCSTPLAAYGAEGYFCVGDYAAGLIFNKVTKQWGPTIFARASDTKFLITKASPEDSARNGSIWLVKEIGWDIPRYTCKEDFNSAGYLYCMEINGTFGFNRKNNRFVSADTWGYIIDGVSELPEGSGTPHIMAGRCSPL